ncbi:DUF4237 domain-containing protein [Solihabitans fulvus]|uniref:DUF4237 domain-containing protein n=1 Tax=Solihabitans fulvus TaxID=1892852 RepID=A0A5B2XBD8_9PSEU|nr:DUF4237 domain-containing protein [Solihabitans fulvus]
MVALAGVALVFVPLAPAADAAPSAGTAETAASECSATFFDGDRRLGPEQLPTSGQVGAELVGYRRTGGLTPQQFLDTYYDPAGNGGTGGWRYPPANGYVLTPDGRPVETQLALFPGQNIDRYGSEYGSFLAPEWLPYATRSIPPQSLDSTPPEGCNYHVYRVLRSFEVHAGPIAAWFAQPGGGLQYQLDGALLPGAPATLNVLWLLNNGYLQRLR